MTFNDLFLEEGIIKKQVNIQNDLIAAKVLDEYFVVKSNDDISYLKSRDSVNDLLYDYFLTYGTDNSILLEKIMQKHGLNYSPIIRDAIIHLLGRNSEIATKIDPIKFPGITAVQLIGKDYQIQTVSGNITVTKASPIFKDTSSHYVFCNHLVGECFNRSYDFAKSCMEGCQVVLSYMPNVFYEGHYHAYLELGSSVLDIASNSFYSSKDDSSKVLDGRIIRKLTYFEIEEEYRSLEERYPELKNTRYNKPLVLSLYYDFKDRLSS